MPKHRDPASSHPSDPDKSFRKFTDIVDRIEQLRAYLRLNKSQFSNAIGMKPQTYNNFIGAQSSKPNVELLHGAVAKFGANPMWILTGRGEMFTGGADGRPGWSPATKSDIGLGRFVSRDDGPSFDTSPEMHTVEPILKRIEEKFER